MSFRLPSLSTLALAGMLAALPLAASAQGAAKDQRYVVMFKKGAPAAAAAREAVRSAGGRVVLDLSEVGAVAVRMSPAAAALVARNPNVEFVEVDHPQRLMGSRMNAPRAMPAVAGETVPYGIPMVQADQVSDANAANRKLCIIDSGYDIAHEDLAANTVTGENLSDVPDWNSDQQRHGTHVAGTIAAIGSNGVGVVGVLPNKKIQLHILKVFGSEGSVASSTVAKAGLRCWRAGSNVISMSLGGSGASRLQEIVFDLLDQRGVLLIAAAGNGGNSAVSYPAGFPTVVSVGAVDSNKVRGSFSQFNPDVELAAPGVAVDSTVPMGTGRAATLTIGATGYPVLPIDGTPTGSVTADLANFGLGEAADPAMAGKLCLTSRGNISFADKVLNCTAGGGLGSVIYNNVPGDLFATLGGVATSIPSASASDTTGAALLGQVGQSATLSVVALDYEPFDGTSMATPHVSAVAALVWSHYPSCTAAQIRASLNNSAMDLGAAGRDNEYGFGLVQAKAAFDRIATLGCGN